MHHPTSADAVHSTVRGACPHDCPDTCALLTTVDNGRATRVQGNPGHRHTDGALGAIATRDIEGQPLLEIHASDAEPRGIRDGQMVRVFNARGEYRCKARVSERARPGVVNGLGIWWRKLGPDGTNVNELTSQRLTDLGRAPVFYDCLVEVAARP